MRRRVYGGVYAFGTVLLAVMAAAGAPSAAQAQTTVVLDAPSSEVADTVVRGGHYADTNFDGGILVTRQSNSSEYVRRVLLKFDTENRIPADVTIRSATLTLTVRGGNDQARRLGAYRIAESFDEQGATWQHRRNGKSWKEEGGYFGRKYAEATVTSTIGSKIRFDVTSLVQETVGGKYGSRFTRIAVLDKGAPARASYREYYSSEADNPDVRPALTVVYDAGRPAGPPKPDDEDDEDDEDNDRDGGNTSTLRVLHWNTHHGRGADGKYDLDRIATWIAKMKPDVVTLNEIERFSNGHGDEDQPARYAALLKGKTGRAWHHHYQSARGGSSGGGSVVLSRYPIHSRSECALGSTNNAVHASIEVNGRTVNIWTTHLPSGNSSSPRVSQTKDILACARQFSENRIVTGDWNATQQRTEYSLMLDGYYDAWAKAKADGTDVDYPGNSRDGATHNYRIDYVFYSKNAALRLQKAQVFDARINGVRASDHKPLLVTFRLN